VQVDDLPSRATGLKARAEVLLTRGFPRAIQATLENANKLLDESWKQHETPAN